MADGLHLPAGDWLGWFCLSTALDDFSRYILAWKLCTTMRDFNVAAVALANKNARVIWALLSRGDDYRPASKAMPSSVAA